MAGAPMGGALRQIHRLFVDGTVAGLPDGQLLDQFLARGDESAFAALVERHGPMVLGTCRAVLRNPDDAEDAFQATFLVLVCKARSIRGRDALGGWLHQVAHRIAIQAGAEAARKRHRERLLGPLTVTDDHTPESDEEWRAVLHEEVARLSDKYRLPLLLCDLEGKTHAQAAGELKCGEATVRRRLSGARDLLRRRLIRRGVTFSVGALSTSLNRSAVAKVPLGWVEATVKAAGSMSSTAARIAVGEVVSSSAAELARKSLRIMLFSQLKTGAAVGIFLIALVGLAWGIGMSGQDKGGSGQTPRMEKARTTPTTRPVQAKTEKPANPIEAITCRGRVLDPDGRPFSGANVYLVSNRLKNLDSPVVRATSGPDGRFHFVVPKSDFDTFDFDATWSNSPIVARAAGYAFGLANYRKDSEELTLQLTRDDVPVSGRILDLEGRPVAGATLTVFDVRSPSRGSLDDWLKALEGRKEFGNPESEFLPTGLGPHRPGQPIIPPVKTGADGRFLIAGIGRSRVATVRIQGSTIETVQVFVRTRPGATIRVPRYQGTADEELITIYGAAFEHVAGPTRPIEGVVRDLDTKAPLAGIMVLGERWLGESNEYVHAITDAQGHYRLVGLPRGREGHVLAVAPVDFPHLPLRGDRKDALPGRRDEDLPYLRAGAKVGEPGGTGPIKLDFNLKRSVWVTGRVIEGDTGKPVFARLEYFVYQDNPHVQGYPVFQEFQQSVITLHFAGRDGAFQFVAFPGPGLLVADPDPRADEYILGAGADTLKHKLKYRYLETYPNGVVPSEHHVIAEIDPAPGTVSLNRDLRVVRGRSLTVTVLGPDGKPLSGNEVAGLSDWSYDHHWEKAPPPEVSTYTILGLRPGKRRTVTFLNPKRGLTGQLVLRGDEIKPQTITLQPWGVLIGRIVDNDGQPCNTGDVLLGVRLPSLAPSDPQGWPLPDRGPCPREVLHPSAHQGQHGRQFGRQGRESRAG
jgi:RNA polymerase sigma factor (sigma-70 family)